MEHEKCGDTHIFDRDISLAQKEEFIFKGNVAENWSINGNPNGGYLMAIMANAALQHSDKSSTPILTANYISRCTPGEADLQVEEISRSIQFNRFQSRLLQDGKEKVRFIGTFADKKNGCFIERYETKMPDIAPLEECIRIPVIPKFTLFDNIDLRLDPVCAGWMTGSLSDKSEQKGWITFRENRPYDIFSVLLMADSFPPPVLASQGVIEWVPTIELTVNIRNIPETRWLKCFFRTRFITCGLLESDGEIWDEKGSLVAISRQIAQFRKKRE
ncbi:MAG: thioesterase family protein [Desulfobacteraceae bacterium]|nr:MAG: thioesterase family protein [Desulfobacteraceae bacterium]